MAIATSAWDYTGGYGTIDDGTIDDGTIDDGTIDDGTSWTKTQEPLLDRGDVTFVATTPKPSPSPSTHDTQGSSKISSGLFASSNLPLNSSPIRLIYTGNVSLVEFRQDANAIQQAVYDALQQFGLSSTADVHLTEFSSSTWDITERSDTSIVITVFPDTMELRDALLHVWNSPINIGAKYRLSGSRLYERNLEVAKGLLSATKIHLMEQQNGLSPPLIVALPSPWFLPSTSDLCDATEVDQITSNLVEITTDPDFHTCISSDYSDDCLEIACLIETQQYPSCALGGNGPLRLHAYSDLILTAPEMRVNAENAEEQEDPTKTSSAVMHLPAAIQLGLALFMMCIL